MTKETRTDDGLKLMTGGVLPLRVPTNKKHPRAPPINIDGEWDGML